MNFIAFQTRLSGEKLVWIVRILCFLGFVVSRLQDIQEFSAYTICLLLEIKWNFFVLFCFVHHFAQRIECGPHYLYLLSNKYDLMPETSLHSPVYFLTVARASYVQRVCFTPVHILRSFKALRLKGGKKGSLRDRIKGRGWVGKGNFSTLKTRLQSPGNQQIKFQSLTRSCKKYREGVWYVCVCVQGSICVLEGAHS